jgi:hypothetical protein
MVGRARVMKAARRMRKLRVARFMIGSLCYFLIIKLVSGSDIHGGSLASVCRRGAIK